MYPEAAQVTRDEDDHLKVSSDRWKTNLWTRVWVSPLPHVEAHILVVAEPSEYENVAYSSQ